MKISFNWLKELIDFNKTPAEISDILRQVGIEVANITDLSIGWDKIVIADILDVRKHPDADKLSLCDVNDSVNQYTIVCGAPNVCSGKKGVFALTGSVLPTGLKIETRKIRGIESNGMLCSAEELGLELSDTTGGIILLENDIRTGTLAKEYFGCNDTIFEIEITPNRGDCLSHIGIARELSVILNKKLNLPKINLPEVGDVKNPIEIKITAPEFCKRYFGQVLTGVKVKNSPQRIKNKLRVCGVRPINNIVDITNYVLLETGHPLHAFDYNKLKNKTIIVRWAKNGETMLCLDGETRMFNDKTSVIADAERPVALAGIMGGEETAVSQNTEIVLLESAYFTPFHIRHTRQQLGMNTEASYRFERGVDWNNIEFSAQRVISLLNEQNCVTNIEPEVDVIATDWKNYNVKLHLEFVNKLLGLKIDKEIIENILTNIGCVIKNKDNNCYDVEIPSYRNDLLLDVDLVEEIARFNGYSKIPVNTNYFVNAEFVEKTEVSNLINQTRDFLKGIGLNEVVNYSFISEKDLENLSIKFENLITLSNPVSQEQTILRPFLTTGLLNTLNHNIRHQTEDVQIYEIGKTYFTNNDTNVEKLTLGILLTGNKFEQSWLQKTSGIDFYYVKGILSSLLSIFKITNFELTQKKISYFTEAQSFDIIINGISAGIIGTIDNKISVKHDCINPVFITELCLEDLAKHCGFDTKYLPISKYPVVRRDISIYVPEQIGFNTIISTIQKSSNKNLLSCVLVDRYQGEGTPKGLTSYLFALYYGSNERTLTKTELEQWQNDLVNKLKTELNCVFRGEN